MLVDTLCVFPSHCNGWDMRVGSGRSWRACKTYASNVFVAAWPAVRAHWDPRGSCHQGGFALCILGHPVRKCERMGHKYLDGRCSCQRECQVALAPESANVTPIHEQDLSISGFFSPAVVLWWVASRGLFDLQRGCALTTNKPVSDSTESRDFPTPRQEM